jgi:hypothetical protein
MATKRSTTPGVDHIGNVLMRRPTQSIRRHDCRMPKLSLLGWELTLATVQEREIEDWCNVLWDGGT